MSLKARGLKARKILVGSVGIATASFVGVGCSSTSVANLPAPPSCEVAPKIPTASVPGRTRDQTRSMPLRTSPPTAEIPAATFRAAMRPATRATTAELVEPCRSSAILPETRPPATRNQASCSSSSSSGGAFERALSPRPPGGRAHALGHARRLRVRRGTPGRRAPGLDRRRVSGAPHRRRVRIDAARARRGARASRSRRDGGAFPARRDRSCRAVRAHGDRARRRHRAACHDPDESVPRPRPVAATRCCAPPIW